jgi:hypothetical protein
MKSWKKALVVGALAAATTVGAVSAARADRTWYGALAYTNAHNKYGWALNYASQNEANAEALHACNSKIRDSTCAVVIEFHDTCAAYAEGDRDIHYGWAGNTDPEAARAAAVAACRGKGGQNCTVRVWGCTRGR